MKQVREWNWLSSQEKRCRDYATNILWIEVETVFNEEWVSWWVFERKSIQELLAYIDKHKESNYIVIFEDLNRLSRDIQVHSLLKSEFKKRWVELASPNFQFEETPEWDFKENISVVVSQYEKDKNKQRVNSRMRARLEQWFWCFRVPLWFKYIKSTNWWKIVIQDETISKKIKYAFEKYANNEIDTLWKLLIYLNSKGLKIKWLWKNNRILSLSSIHWLVTNPLYAWYLKVDKWNIWLTKAQHKGIITFNIFEKIQNKLVLKSKRKREVDIEKNINRIDISNDFPLRWFLYCEKSKKMFSGWWSQWKNSKFPYYTYPKKSPLSWKSINRNTLHNNFEIYLKNIQPKEELIIAFEKAIEIVNKNIKKNNIGIKINLEKDWKNIDKKITKFIDRIWKSNSEILIEHYENEIESLEKEKSIIYSKMNYQHKNVWTLLKRKLNLVRNSLDIWNSSNLENKKLLLKNIFPNGIPINKKKQVWTPTFSLIYQSFSMQESLKMSMVEFINKNLLYLQIIITLYWSKKQYSWNFYTIWYNKYIIFKG